LNFTRAKTPSFRKFFLLLTSRLCGFAGDIDSFGYGSAALGSGERSITVIFYFYSS
jgi:hypothetical protein